MNHFKIAGRHILCLLLLFILPMVLVGCGSNTENSTEQKKYVNIPDEYFVQFTLLQNNCIYFNGKEISVAKHNEIMGQIEQTLIDISKAVNTTIESSTVAKLNRAAAGEEITVDNYTKELLQISQEAYNKSNGLFSPALYNLLQIWGFTPEFEGHYNDARPEPTQAEIDKAKANSNFLDIDLTNLAQNKVSKKRAEVKLDFGGIAKGYMADKVKEVIENALPNGQIDCGFQVMSNTVLMGQVVESNGTKRGFRIGIENPRTQVTGTGSALYMSNLSDIATSTSGDTYRFYKYNGKIYPHILDYTTGRPAENGVISSTVLVPLGRANASTWTDIYSTLGFCMPLTEVVKFYAAEKIGAAVITRDYNYCTVGNDKSVGNFTIENRNTFNKNLQNYYTEIAASAAKDSPQACQRELDYIANKTVGIDTEQTTNSGKNSIWKNVVIFIIVLLFVVIIIFAVIVALNRRKKG